MTHTEKNLWWNKCKTKCSCTETGKDVTLQFELLKKRFTWKPQLISHHQGPAAIYCIGKCYFSLLKYLTAETLGVTCAMTLDQTDKQLQRDKSKTSSMCRMRLPSVCKRTRQTQLPREIFQSRIRGDGADLSVQHDLQPGGQTSLDLHPAAAEDIQEEFRTELKFLFRLPVINRKTCFSIMEDISYEDDRYWKSLVSVDFQCLSELSLNHSDNMSGMPRTYKTFAVFIHSKLNIFGLWTFDWRIEKISVLLLAPFLKITILWGKFLKRLVTRTAATSAREATSTFQALQIINEVGVPPERMHCREHFVQHTGEERSRGIKDPESRYGEKNKTRSPLESVIWWWCMSAVTSATKHEHNL